nr:sigma-70 family RNA polymerase sigma factor [Salsipaludibacter albus]
MGELVAQTQADVWRFCAHLVDVASADDLAQDTYLRAMGSMHRFRGDASARTWLLAIARHACADELRRRTRRRRREHRLDPTDLEGSVADDAHREPSSLGIPDDLAAAVDALDVDRREAFVLTQVLGLSYREAAEAAEVPLGTIRSRVARARGDLVARLAPETDVHDADGREAPDVSGGHVTSAGAHRPPGTPRTPDRRPRRRGA